jgi:hypothetical protein
VCSHTLQNQLPRTRHEASAANTVHLDRRGGVKLRTTHIRNHCTQSMPSAIKPLHHLPSHSSIQPQGRKNREEPCLQPHVAESTTKDTPRSQCFRYHAFGPPRMSQAPHDPPHEPVTKLPSHSPIHPRTIVSGQTGPYHIVRHALLPVFDLYLNQPS